MNSFSKVSAALEDEEDERQRFISDANAKYKAAQDAYTSKGTGADVLKLFEDVESSLGPLLGGGLMSLRPRELEMVLKGRLHRAVIIAQLDGRPDRWARVKALTEDVLQFDFDNCHARWLRGLALLNGLQRRHEAEEEMRRAVACASRTGKAAEAAQWEAEIQSSFGAGDAPDGLAAGASPEGAVPAGSMGETVQGGAVHAAPALQKGFFNRQGPKAGAVAAADAGGPQPRVPQVEEAPQPQQQQQDQHVLREQAHELRLEELRGRLQQREQQLEERGQRQQQQEEELLQWRQGMQEAIATVGSDFERAAGEVVQEPAEDGPAPLDRLRAAAEEALGQLEADRSWAEAGHQKYMDFSTDVVALREMLSRELREREGASKQGIADVRELARRLGDVKAAVRSLREHARAKGAADAQLPGHSEADLQHCNGSAAEFRALPTSAKLWAFVDDAAVLWLMAFASVLGMLVALGFCTEAFSAMGCRFVCAR